MKNNIFISQSDEVIIHYFTRKTSIIYTLKTIHNNILVGR